MKNQAAIENLEQRLADLERKANAIIEVLNDMRQEDGLPPRGPFGGGGDGGSRLSGGGTLTSIKADTFYGKKLQTAVREFLEMRYAAVKGTNPATPREIYDAIVKGGFQFDAKDDVNALVGLRALLRKRTAFFHKLPNGTYGLTAWYPDAKKPKNTGVMIDDDTDADHDDETPEKETATTKKAAAGS